MVLSERRQMLAVCVCLAACIQSAFGAYEVARESAMVGPQTWGGKAWSDKKLFMTGTPITGIAFTSITGYSGLAVYYGDLSAQHGTPLNQALKCDIKKPITKVEVQFTEEKDGKPGSFVSFTFSSAHESFQLGTRVASAKTVTWFAPDGCFLGGFEGMSSETQLLMIQFIWVRTVEPLVPMVGAVTPWFTTGYTSGLPSFDGVKEALEYGGDITQLGGVLAGKGGRSGLSFTYSNTKVLSYGSVLDQVQTLPFATRIVRIQGSFVTPGGKRQGYWGHLKFITREGVEMEFGTPCSQTLVGSREFDFKVPQGQWLGAVRGWATEHQLRSIQFVCFKFGRKKA